MSNDTARILQELEIITGTLIPNADMSKLKIRYEEIINNYSVERKTSVSLDNDLSDKIDLYISARRLESYSELTLVDNKRELNKFAEFVNKPASQVSTPDIRLYLSSNENWSQSTVSKKLAIIKTFYKWCVDEELLLRNPANKIKSPKQPKRLPKALTSMELETLRESCNTLRERALVEVMYSTGCRLSEVSGMLRSEINWLNYSISVVGKGNKERIVYLNEKSIFHLKKYLVECEYEENYSTHLFSTEVRPFRGISKASIQNIIHKISMRSGINKNIHPHVLRHTFATIAMENGIELGDLQQLMGHESSNTTLRYATVSEERKHNAHKRFIQ